MKKLFTSLLLASIFIVSCKDKKENKPPVVVVVDTLPPPTGDTLKILPDVELVNKEMDEKVASFKRKKPIPPPPPPDVPPTQTTPEFCILYDFDGHNVSKTMWNVSGDIPCANSGFNVVQQKEIVDSGRSYFSQFMSGIYVTNDSTIFLQYSSFKRMRVVFTTSNEWYGSSAGGVAYINSANWGDGSPAFVFTKLLGYSSRYSGDAGAHEAGHTLGCRHQSSWSGGVKVSDYNWGGCPITCGSAPIMGASYNQPQPKWWIGLNSLGIIQNDTSVIKATVRQ